MSYSKRMVSPSDGLSPQVRCGEGLVVRRHLGHSSECVT